MASSRLHRDHGWFFWAFAIPLAILSAWPRSAEAQQQVQGFTVERFYPSAPGAGWFVMDDLSMDGGLGGAVSVTTGYSRNPLVVTGTGGTQRLAVVSNEAFAEVSVAATYHRYRVYLELPVPLVVNGTSGSVGPYQFTAPSLNVATNPDTLSDTTVGFDMRLAGRPRGLLRIGAGAELIFPSGNRADYVTDARYRGMFRFLAAGDAGGFSYAGQVGVHVRPLNESPVPDIPAGNEFLYGVAAGRKFTISNGWAAFVGPEIYGETAFHSSAGGQAGTEGLLTGRLEGTGPGRNLRIKVGIGHALVQQFGTPEWRVLFGVEVFGHK